MLRFRRSTLICIVLVGAIAFALFPRNGRLIGELRHDLEIADQHPITILDRVRPDCVLAVVEKEGVFKLFVCYRDFWDGGNSDQWEIPFVVGSGAPPGMPEATIEYSQEFDHFPTASEISHFRREHWLTKYE